MWGIRDSRTGSAQRESRLSPSPSPSLTHELDRLTILSHRRPYSLGAQPGHIIIQTLDPFQKRLPSRQHEQHSPHRRNAPSFPPTMLPSAANARGRARGRTHIIQADDDDAEFVFPGEVLVEPTQEVVHPARRAGRDGAKRVGSPDGVAVSCLGGHKQPLNTSTSVLYTA